MVAPRLPPAAGATTLAAFPAAVSNANDAVGRMRAAISEEAPARSVGTTTAAAANTGTREVTSARQSNTRTSGVISARQGHAVMTWTNQMAMCVRIPARQDDHAAQIAAPRGAPPIRAGDLLIPVPDARHGAHLAQDPDPLVEVRPGVTDRALPAAQSLASDATTTSTTSRVCTDLERCCSGECLRKYFFGGCFGWND